MCDNYAFISICYKRCFCVPKCTIFFKLAKRRWVLSRARNQDYITPPDRPLRCSKAVKKYVRTFDEF